MMHQSCGHTVLDILPVILYQNNDESIYSNFIYWKIKDEGGKII